MRTAVSLLPPVKSSGSFYPANKVNKHLDFAILIKHRISISYFLSQHLYPGPRTGAYGLRYTGRDKDYTISYLNNEEKQNTLKGIFA